MWSRRSFLRATGAVGASALAVRTHGVERVAAASQAVADRSPEDVAQDEFYWREIQSAYAPDRTLINLNNGHHSPSPRVVQDALKRYLDMENQDPVYYAALINRNVERVRRALAMEFGCDAEELAITRNASESLQIAQGGLDLKPGDEVITTDQDYPRMLDDVGSAGAARHIKVTRIQFPVPTTQKDLYDRFERAITPQTKVLHFCHITNITGQLFPVQRPLPHGARSAASRRSSTARTPSRTFPTRSGISSATSTARACTNGCCAPVGNGFLYVRKENIARTWPMQAAGAGATNDIRKFEEVGTMPAAPHAAIAEALAFHQAIGIERKAARLRYLTLRWANALKSEPAHQDPLEPRAGPDLGPGAGRHRRA